jgi:hypothetical protein
MISATNTFEFKKLLATLESMLIAGYEKSQPIPFGMVYIE